MSCKCQRIVYFAFRKKPNESGVCLWDLYKDEELFMASVTKREVNDYLDENGRDQDYFEAFDIEEKWF